MDVEGLIIGLIVMAVASLFGQKKKAEESGRPERPVQTTRQRSMKRAEDYAKEIYGEVQARMEQQPDKTKKIARKVQETIESSPYLEPMQNVAAKDTVGRLSAHKPRTVDQVKAVPDKGKLFPLDSEDIKKSIILAEILMPPKSKR